MADANLKNITSLFKQRLENADLTPSVADEGTVIFTGDGILRVDGLRSAKYFELLQLENGIYAIALNLEEDAVGAVALDREDLVKQGMKVKTTGRLMEVPVGEAMLGRVVNALGKPIDGLGSINTSKTRPVEAAAPAIIDRASVNIPLQTGLLAIDSMIPIGRGQRELIIGDRQTGKTAIALDAIINQRGKDVICVYVAIGQKASGLNLVQQKLAEHGAMDYTVIVSASANESAPLQYLAPYSGCAIAEEFMYKGKDVLIVYDDLSKHAVSYRTLSLLLKRPAGREAFPGDIFYLHSRLLERSGKLSAALGGGSITALPIVETQAGDISAYIPTNVISITDGQIYLETELFNAGIRPAVNLGLSVSRVGGSAQVKAMRSVAGTLRLQLAQYRELAVFTQFGSELDAATKNVIVQGEKLTEILKQPQFSPLPVEIQVVMLYVISLLPLRHVSRRDISKYFDEFIPYIKEHHAETLQEIATEKVLSAENKQKLSDACEDFTSSFIQAN